jgi:SARP family transcriptional regulator, regulator of embCAB operon
LAETRIQLCGRIVAEVDGARIEDALPGAQGRLLFVYLVLNRLRPVPRVELVDALWPDDPPLSVDSALSALLSKLRRRLAIEGRAEVRLVLPDGAWVDLEAATSALHRAEAAVARGDWAEAWGPARVAQHVGVRGFLPGEELPWARETRNRVEGVYLRALELVAQSCLEIGGGELDTALRAARTLVERAPLRESGTRLVMEALDRSGNRGEALLAYDVLRTRMRDELGAAPAEATQALHRRLLG